MIDNPKDRPADNQKTSGKRYGITITFAVAIIALGLLLTSCARHGFNHYGHHVQENTMKGNGNGQGY